MNFVLSPIFHLHRLLLYTELASSTFAEYPSYFPFKPRRIEDVFAEQGTLFLLYTLDSVTHRVVFYWLD
jgi:hypothetical protein